MQDKGEVTNPPVKHIGVLIKVVFVIVVEEAVQSWTCSRILVKHGAVDMMAV